MQPDQLKNLKQDIKFKFVDEGNYKSINLPPKPMRAFDTKISNSNAATYSSTVLNPANIENWTNFSQQYNDLGLNTHIESYSVKQEFIRQAQRNYKMQDVKTLNDKILDLETSLEINKGVIASLMSDANMGDVLKKVNDETTYLKKRLK